MYDLLIQILGSAFRIQLPVIGVSFGILCVSIWSLPMLMRIIKSIF